MRPALDMLLRLIRAVSLALPLFLATVSARAQHAHSGQGHAGIGGTAGHLPGGAIHGVHAGGHHLAGNAAYVGVHHHGHTAGYGAGAGSVWGFGAGYGVPATALYRSYMSSGIAPKMPYGNGVSSFSTAVNYGAGGMYAVPIGVPYYVPLAFAGSSRQDDAAPSSPNRPPPDDAGHFELILPDNAEVLVDGVRTEQTGFVRHCNTPKLTPGSDYHYRVRVRYVNEHGDIVEDTRTIHFHANDWFRIDFTHAPPPKAVPDQ